MFELYNNYFNISGNITWKVAIYARLSREDEKNGQSESIYNQVKFLKEIIRSKGWILVEVYIDDGYTGTNFNRPGFQKMMDDIDNELVNLVITKDLSRLGRDYIETGNYVEKIFPSKNIRYIAVNDNVDTFDRKNTNNDMTPFKSVMNDMYAKDISNKVRTSVVTKAREGDCIKSFLPYGYKKDPFDKNSIMIDDKVSDNVVLIFDLYKQGKSKSEIANILNEKGIITPLKYKLENTNYFNPNKTQNYRWNSTVISNILRNRIYVGDLIQLVYTKVNYKIKKVVKNPTEQQAIIENNHQSIISRDTFNTVQEMLDKKSNEWNYSDRKRHLFAGMAFCKCGSRISYNLNHNKTSRCVCSSYKKYGTKFCSNVHLNENELIDRVTKSLKKNIKSYLNKNDLNYNKILPKKDSKKEIELLIKKSEEINKIIANLYEDKISGVITDDTFSILIKKYEKQKKEYEDKINNIKLKKGDNKQISSDDELLKTIMKEFLKFDIVDEENISLAFKLIDKIVIDNRVVNIFYKFSID